MLLTLIMKTCFLWTAILLYQGSHGSGTEMGPGPHDCGCPDQQNYFYNLEELDSKNNTRPSFTVNYSRYNGYPYAYSFNPCTPFKLGPRGSGCRQKDVAICYWVPYMSQSADTYKTIGNHHGASCDLESETNTPIVVYMNNNRSSDYYGRNSTVKLICDERNKDKATFEVHNEDNRIFHLRYFWKGCPTKQTTLEDSKNAPRNIVIPTAAASAAFVGFLLFVVVPLIVWYKKRNRDNNNVERQRILDDGDQQADIIDNQLEAGNQAHGTRPRPIGASYTKDDINAMRGAARVLGAHA